MVLVRMGFPADPAAVILTSAPAERVGELLREYRAVVERQGWHEELVSDFLRGRLPGLEVQCVTVRGYFAEEWEVSTDGWSRM